MENNVHLTTTTPIHYPIRQSDDPLITSANELELSRQWVQAENERPDSEVLTF